MEINNKIAVLGPAGTFSDYASLEFIKNNDESLKQVFFKTIDDTFHALNNKCKYSIIPIENVLDGYVQRTLDLLLEMDIHIVTEITVPVQFALISNVEVLSDIERIFVQFKTNGQCRKFLDSLDNTTIITTESNMESYSKVCEGINGDAAIVPAHIINKSTHPLIIDNVTDSLDNYTRFVVVTKKQDEIEPLLKDKKIRVPLYIMSENDKPGLLYKILGVFSSNNINLISIMSRPTKKQMGSYNFFIEIEAEYNDLSIIENVLKELNLNYKIKVLGTYSI